MVYLSLAGLVVGIGHAVGKSTDKKKKTKPAASKCTKYIYGRAFSGGQ